MVQLKEKLIEDEENQYYLLEALNEAKMIKSIKSLNISQLQFAELGKCHGRLVEESSLDSCSMELQNALLSSSFSIPSFRIRILRDVLAVAEQLLS